MTSLVEIKQMIRSFYIRFEMWITPLWKFLLSLIMLLTINSHVGYLAALKPLPIVLMMALLCSFMPVGFMALVGSFYIFGHLYAVSIETLGVTLVLFLLMFLLYFRFSPGDTVVLILMPLLFLLKIPYLLPLALGLVASPLSIAAVSCGVVIYYLLAYVQTNATIMGASSVASSEEDTEIIVQLRTFLTGFLTNKEMWVMVAAFAMVIVVVYLLRRLSIDHSWKIAILSGAVLNLIALLIGDFMYDIQISFLGVVIGIFFSAILCFGLEFFFFQLDYTRTERVQFEDDDYYYYVKAVPKVTLAEAERHVKKINRAHHAPKPAPDRSSGTQKNKPEENDYDFDEGETLKERVPARTAASRASASSRAAAPARSGIRTAASQGAPVRAGVSSRPASPPRSPASPRPAAATRNLNSSRSQLPADDMRDRVLRVGEDRTGRTT
jgi:hypothetical protein